MTLSPSDTEVVHYVNDSHIVYCNANGKTRVRWLNPQQTVIEETKGRIHIEEKGGEWKHGTNYVLYIYLNWEFRKTFFSGATALVFESITLQDKGEWSCQGETGNLHKSFHMITNRKLNHETPSFCFYYVFRL